MPDPAEAILRPLPLSDRAKAAAWDVFHQSQSADELRGALDALPLPDEAKAALLGAKAPEAGSALGRFAAGAAEMLNPVSLVKGAYQAVRHPIETGSAVLQSQMGQLSQAAERAGEGRYSEAVGHGLAGVLPLVGPAAAEAGEQIGQGDVAGGLGKGAGLLAPVGIPSAVRAGRRMLPTGAREAAASGLEAGAARRVADVMTPKVGANKTRLGNRAAQVAPEIAANPEMAAWSRTGLHSKVGASLDDAARALDDAADARLAAATFDTEPIIQGLLEKRRLLTAETVEGSRPIPALLGAGGRPTPSGLVRDIPSGQMRPPLVKSARPIGTDVVPGPNAARVAAIDQAIEEIRHLGPVARYEPLRRIRQAYDQPAKVKYNPSLTADYLKQQGGASGAADVTSVLRDQLAKMDPQTAAANAQYSLMKTADDVLEAAAEVERARPRVGRQIMARLTGSVVGGQAAGATGAAAGYILGPIVDAAMNAGLTTQLQTAQLMTRIAAVIRRGDLDQLNSLIGSLGRRVQAQGATLTGRTTSPSESRTGRAPAPDTPY